MKISEILEKMDEFNDHERSKYLGGMWKKVSKISESSLRDFENKWDGTKTFDEFKKAQNEVIRDCIGCEFLVNDIRIEQGLSSMTMDTEIA